MHQRQRVRVSSSLRQTVTATLVAVVLAVIVASIADDLLRAVCAGIGRDSPLYDYFGIEIVLQHSVSRFNLPVGAGECVATRGAYRARLTAGVRV